MNDRIRIIYTEETDSTNTLLAHYNGEEGRRLTVAVADFQTAGRGQGTNRWESEKGKNLLFSVRFHPEGVRADRQFVLLEAMAVAVAEAIEDGRSGFSIKWPNDIYYNDCKIAGTLSECTVRHGMVGTCIIGTGLNVNQSRFRSGAPNPISLFNISGRESDRGKVLGDILSHFEEMLAMAESNPDGVHDIYRKRLYRKTGMHAYRDSTGTFRAEIAGIGHNGHMTLRKENGECATYAFKEVEFII